MKNRFWWLSLHTAICRAPDNLEGFGSFGGGAGGQSGTGGQQGQNDGGNDSGNNDLYSNGGQQSPLIGVNDGNQEDDPLKDILEAWSDPDADDEDDDDQTPVNTEIPQEQIAGMQTAVKNAIAAMRITDDAIPADFDPSDRTQMVSLMNRVMQQTVSQSMNVVFQPVQLAMKQMAQTLQAQIETKINDSRVGMKDSQILESIVPEINNPKYAGMVKGMDETLKAKGKKTKDRATAIRKMLNQMGIREGAGSNGNNRRTSNPNESGNQPSIKTGHAALDSFFGAMPSFTGGGNNGNRR